MSKLVALDDGHGLETAGKQTPVIPELGRRIKENEFNHPTKLKLMDVLFRCGINYVDVAPGQTDIPLKERTDIANNAKADIFVSIHYNAYKGVWGDHGGIETFHYPTSTNGKKLAGMVQAELAKASGLKNRGVKSDNFHVLRETNMPAILCECGFMDNLEEAMLMLDEGYQWKIAEAIGKGICEYFGLVYIKPNEPQLNKNPIMGKAQVTVEQMVAFLLQNNPNPKISCTPEQLVKYFIDEGNIEGIRGDIAFAQSIKETGYFRYGGQVLPEQNNYAGIGATNNSPVGKGAWFDAAQIGVRAQIQHLKAYANKETLKNPCVDPRFSLVTRGVAPNWEDLNGRWAVPGPNYGQDIIAIWNKMLGVPVAPSIDYKKLYEEQKIIASNLTLANNQLQSANAKLLNTMAQIKKLTEI